MQHITSTSCRATSTAKFFPPKSFYKLTRVFITFIISLILLSSILTEAIPTLNKRDNNLDDLKKFAQYASAANCDSSEFPKWNCGSLCDATKGTIVTKFFTTKVNGVQAYIAKHDEKKLIVTAFRGTINVKNMIVDGEVALRDFPPAKGAQVHTGFFQAFLESRSYTFNEVQKLHEENPSYKIVYAGHSLGGALAVLSALDHVQNSTDLITNENLFVFTYGEPRLGNPKFAEFVDSKLKISRTVNGGELIAHLPPRIIGYRHHSGELFISDPKKDSSKFIQCEGEEDPKCSISVPASNISLELHLGPYYGVYMYTCIKNFKSTGNYVNNILHLNNRSII